MEIPLPILAAVAGAVAGGIVSLLVERRKRREEASLGHLQRQIEELYGPLYGLIQFGTAINEIDLCFTGYLVAGLIRVQAGWSTSCSEKLIP